MLPISPRILYVCLSVHRCICVENKNQLDATEWFMALIICSTCFGHFYAHHQDLEPICVLLPPIVCSAWLLVVGGQMQGSRLCIQEEWYCKTAVVQHPCSRMIILTRDLPQKYSKSHRFCEHYNLEAD